MVRSYERFTVRIVVLTDEGVFKVSIAGLEEGDGDVGVLAQARSEDTPGDLQNIA